MINFILIALFLSLGALAKSRNWLPLGTSEKLNQFVIFICLPAIVLVKIPQLAIDSQLLLPTLLPWAMVATACITVVIASKFFNWSRSITGCLLMVCCFGNTSFFGFPMVRAFWGEAGLPYAVVYDVLGSFLSLAVVGNLILAIYSGGQAFSFSATIKRVVTFPPFIAILLALAIKGWTYPSWLEQSLIFVGHMLVPSTMFLVGMHLSFRVAQRIIKPLQLVLVVKLVALPLIAFSSVQFIFSVSVDETLIRQVSIFEAAMPPMVTASVMAIHAKLEPELAAASVGIGLFVSCLTLPVWFFVLS